TDNMTVGEMLDDSDRGEDDFTDISGQRATDVESDTDRKVAEFESSDKAGDNVRATISVVDPATGMQGTFIITDASSKNVSKDETADSTDMHVASGVNAVGTDTINGDDDVTEKRQSSDHGTLISTTHGTDTQG